MIAVRISIFVKVGPALVAAPLDVSQSGTPASGGPTGLNVTAKRTGVRL